MARRTRSDADIEDANDDEVVSAPPLQSTDLDTRESLILAQAVYEFGTKEWPKVVHIMTNHRLIDRPSSAFTPESCAKVWAALMSEAAIEFTDEQVSRKHGLPLRHLAHVLHQKRLAELKDHIAAEEAQFKKVAAEIEAIRSGEWDDKIKAMAGDAFDPFDNFDPGDQGDDVIDEERELDVSVTGGFEEEPRNTVLPDAEEEHKNTPQSPPKVEHDEGQGHEASAAPNSSVVEKGRSSQPLEVGDEETIDVNREVREPRVEADAEVEAEVASANSDEDEDVIIIDDEPAEAPPASQEEPSQELPHEEPTERSRATSATRDADETQARSEGVVDVGGDSDGEHESQDGQREQKETSPEIPLALETELVPSLSSSPSPATLPEPKTRAQAKRKASEAASELSSSGRNPKKARDDSNSLEEEDSASARRRAAESAKKFERVIMMLHSDISNHRNGTIFQNPIKPSEAPDYREIVKRPMDLKTMKARIKSGTIASSLEFQRDIFLMFANSMMYNRPSSDIYHMAEEMMLESEAKIQEFRQTEVLRGA